MSTSSFINKVLFKIFIFISINFNNFIFAKPGKKTCNIDFGDKLTRFLDKSEAWVFANNTNKSIAFIAAVGAGAVLGRVLFPDPVLASCCGGTLEVGQTCGGCACVATEAKKIYNTPRYNGPIDMNKCL